MVKKKNKKKNAVMVTGGAGFIGSHIVDELLKRGNYVVVVDNFSSGKMENLPVNENLLVYTIDISIDDMIHIFKKFNIETIYHLAAIPKVQFSIQDPVSTHLANIDGTFVLLEYARKFNVKRFIFSSSSSIYGENSQPGIQLHEDFPADVLSPYALHKLVGEYYCNLYSKLYNIKTVSLRYFNVFGPRQDPNGEYAGAIPKFIKLIKEGKPITVWNTGKQRRAFVSVYDVVKANILAGSTNNKKCFGRTFNIGNYENQSVNEIINLLTLGFGSKIKLIRGKVKVIEPLETLPDLTNSKRLLGWEPIEDFHYRLQELF